MKWKRGCHLPVLAAVVLLWSMFNISTVIGAGAARVTVDAAAVLSERAVNPLGINTNYIMDDDNNRAPDRPLAEALAEMGVRFLRYPGGEKSDAYLWSVPPFEAPKPTLARVGRGEWPSGAHHFVRESDFKTFKFDPLDFDEFIALCRATGTEPNVVVCYDCIYKPGAWVGRQDLIDTAAAWVRYANVVKGYGVKYWEIGNEAWDALDTNNQLTPTGRALAIWGQFRLARMVAAQSGDPLVRAFASHDPATGALHVFLINKAGAKRQVAVDVKNCALKKTGALWRLAGEGHADLFPVWARTGKVTAAKNQFTLTLAPVSLTVVEL